MRLWSVWGNGYIGEGAERFPVRESYRVGVKSFVMEKIQQWVLQWRKCGSLMAVKG